MGNHVHQFEEEFSKYIGTRFGVATNSCTSALEATLKAIHIQGYEVIIPPQTFIATGAAVVNTGGKVVFADINKEDFNISYQSIKDKITPKTKAIIIVHYGGLINKEIWAIKKLCEDNNIFLIEDCAHAHGASIDSIKAGNIGDVGCFSFYATKIMTTGEGGMVTTTNEELHEVIASIRNRGIDITTNQEIFVRAGSNYRMAEINAILGLSQLSHLDDFVKHRNMIASIYNDSLREVENMNYIDLIRWPDNITNSLWRYTLKLNKKIDRIVLKDTLLQKEIRIDWPYDPPLHLQPVFKTIYGDMKGTLPIAEEEMKHHICLPMNMVITEDDASLIGDVVAEEVQKTCL